MTKQEQNKVVLTGWEGEGGSASDSSRDASEAARAAYLPALPAGCQIQPGGAFRDRTGRFLYELHRVYGPAASSETRGLTCRLDEGLTFWGVTWSMLDETGSEGPAGRWLSYAQVRKQLGIHLPFERFSSVLLMRNEIPVLLGIESHSGGAPPRGAPRSGPARAEITVEEVLHGS